MCKNCGENAPIWQFFVFDNINYQELAEFQVCDACLMDAIHKMESSKARYLFDRIDKPKVKRRGM